MKSKKLKIVWTVVAVVLLLIVTAVALTYFLFFRKLEGTVVDFNYEEYVFECPNFADCEKLSDVSVAEKFSELMCGFDTLENWCYVGTLSGYGLFGKDSRVDNSGLEIVKKQGNEYYQIVRTHSKGKLVAPISINSAVRNHVSDGKLYSAVIADESRYSGDGNIDWTGLSFAEVSGDTSKQQESIRQCLRFIAEEDLISDTSKAYSYGGKHYLELFIDVSGFSTAQVFDILMGKVSNEAMKLGLDLFSSDKNAIDMSGVLVTYVLEYLPETGTICGRGFNMLGTARAKMGLITVEIKMDISMNAVVLYEEAAYTVTAADLLA